MNIQNASVFLRKLFQHNIDIEENRYKLTPMVWGPPGVGKSSVISQLTRELRTKTDSEPYELRDIRLSTLSALDVRGVPHITGDDRFEFLPPPFMPFEGENVVLFFDEVNTATPSNQVPAYEIALDYKLGGHALPQSTLVVLGGNRTEDRGATFEMPVPLANRLVHIEIEPDVDSFLSYGMHRGLSDSVMAFVKFRPELLFKMPQGRQRAFPSPRSWEFVSQLLGMQPSLEEIAGVVGEGAAGEFISFYKMRKHLPDLEQIIEKGETFDHADQSVRYAYTVGLAQRFVSYIQKSPTSTKVDTWASNYLKALQVMPEELMTMGIFLLKGTVALRPIVQNKGFNAIRNSVRAVLQ